MAAIDNNINDKFDMTQSRSYRDDCLRICHKARVNFHYIFLGVEEAGVLKSKVDIQGFIDSLNNLRIMLDKSLELQEKELLVESNQESKDQQRIQLLKTGNKRTKKMLELLWVSQQEIEFVYGLFKAKAALLGKKPSIGPSSTPKSLIEFYEIINSILASDSQAYGKQQTDKIVPFIFPPLEDKENYFASMTSKKLTNARMICALYYALEAEFGDDRTNNKFSVNDHEKIKSFMGAFGRYPPLLLEEAVALWKIDYDWKNYLTANEIAIRLQGIQSIVNIFNTRNRTYDTVCEPIFILKCLMESKISKDDKSMHSDLALKYLLSMKTHLEPPKNCNDAEILVNVRLNNKLFQDALIFQRNLFETNKFAWEENLLELIFSKLVKEKEKMNIFELPLLEREQVVLNRILHQSTKNLKEKHDGLSTGLLNSIKSTTLNMPDVLKSFEHEFEESQRHESRLEECIWINTC